jgi:chaperonin cofactor prefoldin
MSNTIGMELHEEIVTDLQYKLEQLENEVDDLNEEIEDNKDEYKETIENLEKKIVDTLNDKKVRIEGDERDEAYNYAIEVCVYYVEDMFKELLNKLGGNKDVE